MCVSRIRRRGNDKAARGDGRDNIWSKNGRLEAHRTAGCIEDEAGDMLLRLGISR